MDVSGTPCQAHSKQGMRLGDDDPRAETFRIWVTWLILANIPIVLHENVPEFGMEKLIQVLGGTYIVHRIVLDCWQVGFPCIARRRQYCILYHRRLVTITHEPADVFELVAHI